MLRLNESQRDDLRTAVRAIGSIDTVRAELARLYADFQVELDARKPRCDRSGRCCRFEEYGHRLFVTTLELAAFVDSVRPLSPSPGTPGEGRGEGRASEIASRPHPNPLPVYGSTELAEVRAREPDRPWDGTGCPYQIDGLCSVHTIRPFGCRVYFCDPTATEWQNEQYERFHNRLKSMHQTHGAAYYYVEWREALSALGLATEPKNPGCSLPIV
ncbi:MAG: hypothetical protein QM770_18315 [Tepidisphaeraceae bacterium]